MKNLKKIVILAFNPPYLPMIQTGLKEYEFRDKIGIDWKEGTEVYLAITKNGGGSGMVEAKFTIGNIYENKGHNAYYLLPNNKHILANNQRRAWQATGFGNQRYAIEIKDFEMLPEPIELKEVYAYNKVEAEMVSFAKEFVKDFYSKANKNVQKQKLNEFVKETEINFPNNLHYYKACKINRMPQSWCYGGVIQNV